MKTSNSTLHSPTPACGCLYINIRIIFYTASLKKLKTTEFPSPNNIIALQQEFPSPNNIIALCGKAEKQECKAQGQKLTDPPDLMEWTAVRQQFSPGQRERRTYPS
jgi:hypothetical protein